MATKHVFLVLCVLLVGCTAQQQLVTPLPATVPESSVERHAGVSIVNVETLNTPADEFAPVPRVGGRLLFFTSDRSGSDGQDLYAAVRSGMSWGVLTPLPALNSGKNDGACTLSPDGQSMYFAAVNRKGGQGDGDLWLSELRAGIWSEPVNLGPAVNSPQWESQPSLSPDGRILYFSSNRGGGNGGRDIWMTTKGRDGIWSAPVNLGSRVNTEHRSRWNDTMFFKQRTSFYRWFRCVCSETGGERLGQAAKHRHSREYRCE
jgi:Tol biopolymer transport system component